MTTWTEGGVANPSRQDVPPAPGKEILVDGAAYAHPWSFIPGFAGINDAFNNAMTAQIEAKSDDPAPVISATSSAIDQALGSSGEARNPGRALWQPTHRASRGPAACPTDGPSSSRA